MSKRKKESIEPLQIIRTETVLSRMPIHNLSKQKKVKILITRKNENGDLDLYWEISHNATYGPPGQLAYKIDTLIVNRRINELGRPVPAVLRLASQNEICTELGLPATGKNRTGIKKALRQNAFTGITAKIDYKGRDGSKRRLEADFTRYSVIFTGEKFPDGKKADAIHIIFNELYREVLNHAPVRPLDYTYLKSLTPTAQRFYEIISYRIFPALKYQHSQAKLLYSEYCTFSAQPRYYEYEPFRKQMFKVHKPHLESGYIDQVEYQETIDAEGQRDWLMCYAMGQKAKTEYQAFNNRQPLDRDVIDIKKESSQKKSGSKVARAPKKTISQQIAMATEQAATQQQTTPTSKASQQAKAKQQTDAALQLVQYFHERVRGQENYQPYKGSKEKSQAAALLADYGLEKAMFVIGFAAEEAHKTNFQMRTLGAVLQYVNDAVAQYDCQQKDLERQRVQEEAERQQQEQYINRRLQALTQEQYDILYEKIRRRMLLELPQLASQQDSDFFQRFIKREMVSALTSQESKKE